VRFGHRFLAFSAITPFESKNRFLGKLRLIVNLFRLLGVENSPDHLSRTLGKSYGTLLPNRQKTIFSIFNELFTVFIESKNSKKITKIFILSN
jgi:hypothetical protein